MQYVLTIFYEGADLHKSIFLNALKYGIIDICFLRKSQLLPINVEC